MKFTLNQIVIGMASVLACAAQADTLQKIKQTGTVTMGVRESSGVLSYTLGNGQYVGYQIDLCNRALDEVRRQLDLPKLEIKHQVVSSANRIPLLQNGTIDVECGSTTNNATRQQLVAFALTTYVEEIRIAVKTDSAIESISQLSGRKVVTTSGTTSVALLRKHKRADGIQFETFMSKDHSDSMLNLESGRADAFVMDAQVLAGNIAKMRTPKDYKIVGEVLGQEPIAIMLRKDDPALKKIFDDTLRSMMKSGEIAKVYDKWFMQPIPPTNTSVNLPASEATKAAWASPNDKPAEEYARP